MPLPRLPRVEVALGMPLDQLTLERLQQLITSSAVPEDFDLDFKEEPYGQKDDDKRELAKDLSAMANTLGGVILLGVKEENGVGVAVSEVTFSETEELRMRQVLASLVAPPLAGVEIKRLERTDDRSRGVYALVVPRSTQAPHAVRIGDSLRYHQRDGAKSRPLSENEVANLYRNRFAEARSQVARLEQVFADGHAGLGDPSLLYLAVALVPNAPGITRLTHESEEEYRRWAFRLGQQHYHPVRAGVWRGSTGLRRIILSDEQREGDRASWRYAELHTDGTGLVAYNVGRMLDENTARHGTTVSELLCTFHDIVQVLAEHAQAHCSVSGDAILRASLLQMKGYGRAIGILRRTGFDPEVITKRLVVELKPSDHTLSIDHLRASAVERLRAARLVLSDLVQQLGVAELDAVTDDGHIRARAWWGDPADLRRWAQHHGITLSSS